MIKQLMMKPAMIKIILTVFVGYFFLVGFLYVRQKSMIYFPDTKDFYDCNFFEKDEMKSYNNTRFYEQRGSKDGVIIFFHGNAGRACERVTIKRLLEKTEYSVIFVEYSGYAQGAEIQPDIGGILQNVDDIGEYVDKQKYSEVLVLGRSLGTGPAAYYAGKYQTQKLLLISPYSQLYKVAADKYKVFPVKHLFTQNFNSEKYLQNYTDNLLIIHGEKDVVIPYKLGRELYNSIDIENKEFLNLEEATHHNVFGFDIVNEKILNFFTEKLREIL